MKTEFYIFDSKRRNKFKNKSNHIKSSYYYIAQQSKYHIIIIEIECIQSCH